MAKIAVTSLAVMMFAVSCGNDEEEPENGNNEDELPTSTFDGKITAIVENGDDYNSTVTKVEALSLSNNIGDGDNLVAYGNYSNGGFILTLPPTPDEKFLFSIADDVFDERLSVSDKTTMLCQVSFYAFSSSEELVDDIIYGKFDTNSYSNVVFWYADKDVTIIGSIVNNSNRTQNYKISLKRGWNMLYHTNTGTVSEYSTEAVSGLKWYFEEKFEW